MKKIFLAVLVMIIYSPILRSEIYNLTLEESIEIAKEKSYTMQSLLQDLKIAEYNLKSTTSRLKTHIDMEFALPDYSQTVRQKADSTGVFMSVKELTYSSNLTITQPLPTDGNIFLETGVATFKDYYTENRSSNLVTRIRLKQPINAFYAYNGIKSDLKRAQLNYERSNKNLKRAELELVYRVSSSYYSLLLLQKRAEIASQDLERQTEAYDISKNKYEAGLIREVDALQMEVDLAEAQSVYDVAILEHNSSINSFKYLIGIDLDDDVVLNNELVYGVIIVDPQEAVQLALENRLELREQEIEIELNKIAIKQQKAQRMISGTLDAYFEKVGIAPHENINIPRSIENSYDDFLDRPSNYGVTFTIKVPIFDWGENKALVRAAQSRLKKVELAKEDLERDIETEVRNLASSVNSNLKRLQLLEKNVAVAEKSFEITLQRFSDGDIDSQSLALERSRLNTAYTSHLNAFINYQLTLADLMQKTLYDFRSRQLVN